MTDEGVTTYVWDNFGNIQMEILPSGEILDYLYTYTDIDGIPLLTGLSYMGDTYSYVLNEEEKIISLEDSTEQLICSYEYNEYGLPLVVYEVKGNQHVEHQDNSDDEFIGCLNSLRYSGDCYDVETGIYCMRTGSYYDPENNAVLGSSCNVDMKKLFGDQYNELKASYDSGASQNSARLTSNEIYDLTYAASQFYETGINYYLSAGSGSNWYTSYTGTKMYFSASGTTVPSFYTILTKSQAFTSINANAKNAMDASNVAYQEAFWIASCMYVCDTFERFNAIVPRPTGVSHQCYNRGALSSGSKPKSTWSHVVFPGWSTDYTGAGNYSAFPYYSNISRFNVLFSYPSENLYIKSVYYN